MTPGGNRLGQRLAQAGGRGEVVEAPGNAREALERFFHAGRPMVCIMALGIVVRILGPLARDKESDPPVVVIDEGGRFAVSVLGGHGAGANALAREVAALLGAEAVITTASDALGMPAVDLIGREWGWQIDRPEDLTAVAAAVVRRGLIGVRQTAGRRDWWQPFGNWPETFQRLETWPSAMRFAALLAIADGVVPVPASIPTVIYRPPTLVLGVGCRRGVPCVEIETMFHELCEVHGYSPRSLGVVATASLKEHEPGLRQFAAERGVPLRAFSLEELAAVGPLPTPSENVQAKIGIAGVAEPAALLAAATDTLLVPKCSGPRITMALARREGA
jgi:cobalamin biosynthesis protein CbiG